MKHTLLLAPLLLLAGCATVSRQLNREGTLIDNPARDWRQVATSADRERLREWRSNFTAALGVARASGAGAQVAAEGVLLLPDAALPGPALPAGTYRCRTVRIGARLVGLPPYRADQGFACRVRALRGLQGFVVPGGAQRPIGMIFPGDKLRSVFLGTLMLGDERRALQYGSDRDRDMAGYVERIGPRRWRMLLPRPSFESLFEVIELTPTS